MSFFERVAELHPDAPRPFAIGNCQAGYQTLMVAILRPDLFGPCLVAGSPMSYWQGVHGKNPMRYSGGLLGGSWLTAMTSDLGNGKIDGTGLILNFDMSEPGELAVGQAIRGLHAYRHRRGALPQVREMVGRLHPAERRRAAVPGRQPVHRRQADPQPVAVAAMARSLIFAASPRRSSCSPRRTTTSVRRRRRLAGSSICIGTSKTSAPPAERSSIA